MKRVVCFLALAAAACDSGPTGTQPQPPLTLEAGAPAPASPRRMVFHRNPFGDALQADNLMVDGDFELTGRTDQAPWFVYDPNQGQQTLNYDTGGHCRSGVRCGVLTAPQVMIGYMASPKLLDMNVRAYAKPSTGKCADVSILEFDFATGLAGKSTSPVDKSPGPDGWCVYEAVYPNLALEQPALYIELASSKMTATLDEVSVLPVGEAPVHGIVAPPKEVDDATKARVAAVAAWMRAHRRYGVDRKPEVK